MMPIVATVPVETVSEANRHEHWRYRQKRAAAQREAVALHLRAVLAGRTPPLPCTAVLTRLSSRALDDDNLRGALKHVRDQVAEELGLKNDRDPRVSWMYDQARGKPKGVRIALVPM